MHMLPAGRLNSDAKVPYHSYTYVTDLRSELVYTEQALVLLR